MLEHRRSRPQPIAWLYVGFALTGIGTTLLGCVLPALIRDWHLDDRRAGVLFAAQFMASALGALLVRGDFFRSLVSGYVILIASAASLALFAGSVNAVLFFAFGLGLGLTMTATNLLVGSTFRDNRGAALSVLNAAWGLGAFVTPAIASLWIGHWSPMFIYLALAAGMTLSLVVIGVRREALVAESKSFPVGSGAGRQLGLVSTFAAIAFLYVGTEASVSGWMMTYVSRLPISGREWSPIAASGFWGALILGRALVPTVMRWLTEAQLLTSTLTIAFMSVLVLLLTHAPLVIVLSATVAGFVLGPIFPLCLSRVLTLMNNSADSKWVFAICGLGAAFLPWLTGEVSAHSGSLRIGLLVPVSALSAMIILDRLGSSQDVAQQTVLKAQSRS